MNNIEIPTRKDWGIDESDEDSPEFDDLFDAYEEFGGKSIEEISPRFFTPSMLRMEYLYYMPVVPFQYYIFSVKPFFFSEKHGAVYVDEASDLASIFLRLIHRKLINQPKDVMPIIDDLMPLIEHVANNQLLYDADFKIYGSFLEILHDIQTLVNRFKENKKSLGE